jgi:hypothetical protein
MLTFSLSDKIGIQLLHRNVNEGQHDASESEEVVGGGKAGIDNDGSDNNNPLSDSADSNNHSTERHNRDRNSAPEGGGDTNRFLEDSDGDRVLDDLDQCPRHPESFNGINDSDGCPDVAPPVDNDSDEVPDESDNCPDVPNPTQSNIDADAMGDACDPDDDNDTVPDGIDACPFEPETFNTLDDSDGCPDVFEPLLPLPAPLPGISIDDVLLTESNSGTRNFDFTLTRTGDASVASSVDFATADGTAIGAESDYASASGTLDFAPGETTITLTISVNGDTSVEADETFNVVLSNCIGCNLSDSLGVGTILDDDFPPSDTCDGDNNNDQIIDEGIVGVDDNGNGLVDEPGDACPLPLPPPAADPCDGMDNNGNDIIDEGIIGLDEDNDGTPDEADEACPIPSDSPSDEVPASPS